MRIPTPRQTLLIGLLALIPVATYGFLRGDLMVLLSVLSVLVILWALFKAFEPIEQSPTHASA